MGYATTGAYNVTVVDGQTFTGLYAPDGSINVVVAPGDTFVGAYHPCGAAYVTVAPEGAVGLFAPDGSVYVSETNTGTVRYVNVVSGDLGGGGGDTPEWLPENAVAYADFVNGHYYAGGATTTLGAMFVEDAANWSPFDPGTDITGDGLVSNGPVFSGDLLSTALSGATFVFEFTTDGNAQLQIAYYDSPDYTLYTRYKCDTLDGATSEPLDAPAAGSHKAAVTFDGTHLAVSTDGAAVVTVAASADWALRNAVGLGVDVPGFALRSITVYPVQDDADLPTLSVAA